VAVPEAWLPHGVALVAEPPGGHCAVLDFVGTSAGIGTARAAMMGRWLPSRGLQLDSRPSFEHDGPASHFDLGTGVSDCELCFSVVSL